MTAFQKNTFTLNPKIDHLASLYVLHVLVSHYVQRVIIFIDDLQVVEIEQGGEEDRESSVQSRKSGNISSPIPQNMMLRTKYSRVR